MAIAKLQPDATVSKQTTAPTAIPETPKSIFTSLIPETKVASLLKYVEGYPWSVNYYGQLLNSNNSVEHFDPSAPNLTQPFYKVNGMVIQVSSPLSASYDEAKGVTVITGSALMPFKVIPNVGDLFLAQVDNGEDAIFHITSVVRKSHRKESLYEVNYSLHTYTSEDPNFITILESRINETYFFNKDSNFFNRDVLIKPSVKEARDRLHVFLTESKQFYFSSFINPRTSSLLVPGHPSTLYDPVLTRFIAKTVELSNFPSTSLHQHAYSSQELDQMSILDCMVKRQLPHPTQMNQTFNFISSYSLPKRARLGTVSFNGVSYIIYPTNPNHSYKTGTVDVIEQECINTIKTDINYRQIDELVIETKNNDQVYSTFLLPELFVDDYYIVTENFYKYFNDKTVYEELSYIEILLYKFFKQEPIAPEDLAVCVERYHDWSVLHKFYMLPVMWLLIKANT